MRIDLHLHTWFSDGSCSPHTVAAEAAQQRLRAWALTDHDCLDGWAALRDAPGLIPGVEITCSHEGREVHVVGLGFDPADAELNDFLAGIRRLRHVRFGRLRALVEAHYGCRLPDPIDCGPSVSPSRLHLARALQRTGIITHAQQAFADCLGDAQLRGSDLPAFPAVAEGAALLRSAGGVALLAHPGVYGGIELIDRLMRIGELDGLETNHPKLPDGLRRGIEDLATRHGWLRSCGSDFHWHGSRRIGDWRLSHAAAAPLLQRIGWSDALTRQAG
ncbi:MAG: PHP domain-containing protein [Planctomycetota bacterium]